MNLLLGTAMWGWTVDARMAHQLLDAFYAAGFREVDAATNYPIDRDPAHFRLSETILLDWIRAHGVQDLRATIKVGSLDNMRSPDCLLNRSFLAMNLDYYRNRFGSNLDTFMIHWDNRNDPSEIRDTLEGLQQAAEAGLRPGLSGIRHPELYAQSSLDFRIQVKHNLWQSAYPAYAPFHGKKCFIAYGIHAGGVKPDGDYGPASSLRARGGTAPADDAVLEKLRQLPGIQNLTQAGMIFVAGHPDFEGLITGPSRIEQLAATLDFYRELQTRDYSDIYRQL